VVTEPSRKLRLHRHRDIAVIIATSWFRKAVITTHNPTI